MGNLVYTDNKWDGSSEKIAHHRVRENGEVLTPLNVVNDMLDLAVPDLGISETVLEPSCGTGNFLIEILKRKVQKAKTDTDILVACSSLYGVDIARDNVTYSRYRLVKWLGQRVSDNEYLLACCARILELNILWGNTLTGETCVSKILKKPVIVCNEYDKNLKTNKEITKIKGAVIPLKLRMPVWYTDRFSKYLEGNIFLSQFDDLYTFEYFEDDSLRVEERKQAVQNISLEDIFDL